MRDITNHVHIVRLLTGIYNNNPRIGSSYASTAHGYWWTLADSCNNSWSCHCIVSFHHHISSWWQSTPKNGKYSKWYLIHCQNRLSQNITNIWCIITISINIYRKQCLFWFMPWCFLLPVEYWLKNITRCKTQLEGIKVWPLEVWQSLQELSCLWTLYFWLNKLWKNEKIGEIQYINSPKSWPNDSFMYK